MIADALLSCWPWLALVAVLLVLIAHERTWWPAVRSALIDAYCIADHLVTGDTHYKDRAPRC